MFILKIQPIGQSLSSLTQPVANNRTGSHMPKIPKPPVDLTPPPPLDIEQPGNPSSWYKGITKLLTGATNWMANIQKRMTESLLGDPDAEPNALRHMMFMASAVIGKMYDLFSYAIQMFEENKKLEKDTFSLAKAA